MYGLALRRSVERVFAKLAKKAPKQLRIIDEKLEEVRADPHRYKNLRSPLQHPRRVHIDGSFVLVYSIDEATKTVVVEDYDHNDRIYVRR